LRMKVVQVLDLGKVCAGNGIMVNAFVGIASALDVPPYIPAEAFHRKRPIRPDRADHPDAWSNVKQSVDGDGTGCESKWIVSVIESMRYVNKKVKGSWKTYFS
jgi:hypothetical protein